MSAPAPPTAEGIAARLHPGVRASLAAITCEQETESTQLRALAASVSGGEHAVFFAEQQSAGVGRRGRRWISPPGGNLYFSVTRQFDGAASRLSGLSLVVGVAIAEGLQGLGFGGVALKWPNDLVVGDRKLGGVLIELRPHPEGGTRAAIGIGLNVHMPAQEATRIDQPWCDLAQQGQPLPPRDAIAAALLNALLPALDEFASGGLPCFQSRWARLDALQGQAVKIADGLREIHGTCLGINDSGALRLRTADGERAFSGGEVSLRRA